MTRITHVPERSCFACGRRAAKRDLVRVVRTTEDSIQVDLTGHMPGRGSYLCRKSECWTEGLKKTRLERVLRCTVPAEAQERLLAYSREELATP